jgi:hypothetical protein
MRVWSTLLAPSLSKNEPEGEKISNGRFSAPLTGIQGVDLFINLAGRSFSKVSSDIFKRTYIFVRTIWCVIRFFQRCSRRQGAISGASQRGVDKCVAYSDRFTSRTECDHPSFGNIPESSNSKEGAEADLFYSLAEHVPRNQALRVFLPIADRVSLHHCERLIFS